ncbi:hypothetical protein ABL840_09185 [Variovorax sp. NFACC27]|uniref:phage tail fiber protein n=1 Tax=unclassified Variovorax TaxID=663243 RepID=UPI000895CC27|nr:hypothetical protein SAMN03159371_05261 [Variovorax sp. NFACC28]SEG89699.1 hypothetical protein SAMN03159365_05186 [Variovorax sp. NFACC29]SFD40059.1 hypothetical protein SAMN03159379_05151 [Variovorax sp. NFACC26]SFG42362.1 hypothetical protein SAMN03159447_03261 [Variovorax sp. NFACC27]
MATITAANSTFTLAVADLYPSPQPIQGFAADDAFSTDALDLAEVVMGVDGYMSSGFVFNPIRMPVTIMPTSPSLVVFNTLVSAMQTTREVFRLDGTIWLPSIRMKFTLQNGVLSSGKPLPDVKKVLQAVQYGITWNMIVGEPY